MGLTEMQQLAVDLRDRPLLVSAAAGSGKTSVLARRVTALLAGDGCAPVDADRMLIVTFTRAASAELRERITGELESRAAACPQDENLQRQRRLLPQAQISTIDALCKLLLEQNFEKVGLPASFGVIQGGALTALQNEVIAELLEENYAEPDESFTALRMLCENGSDRNIAQILNDTYATGCAEPDLAMWIACCKARRDEKMTEDIRREEALAADLLPRMQALYQSAKTLPAMRSSVREILDHPKRRTKDFDAKAPERALKTEQYGIWSDGLLAALDAAEQGEQTLAGYAKALRLLPPKPTKTGYKLLHDDGILAPWLVCWKEASQIQKMLADISISDFGRDRITCMAADKVYELVLKLHERLLARKLSQNQLAFYDLEQYAVRLLADAELTEQHEVVFTQTDAAKAIAADYDCVMVDECQDNNSVQDIIFRMLTDGTDHLFMVGDVKQSIYRFRHAKPELFSNRQQTYAAADAAQSGDPTCIVLKDNFRSRRSVVDAVNYLFTRIMSPVCGEVRYDAAAAMRAARSYPALPPPFSSDTELHLLDNFREDKRVPKIDQAEYIAEVIAEKIRIGFPVTDAATGNLRPCRYSDFMVLMRNRAILPRLVSALEAQHISYRTEGIKGFYKTSEIAACLAMLRAVQNPQEDVSLWGYLLSPFGLFDFDDAAQLRLIANANGCRYIADALRIAAEDEKSELTHKAEYALTLLRRLRRDSMRMTLSDFLRTAFVRSHTRALLGAGEDGGQKTANLDLLQKDAQTWETTHTGGIAGYLNYVEQLLENDEDIASACALTQNDDVVSVMTVHGSKGLEAPIVLLCSCEKQFNSLDIGGGYLLDADYGLALQYRDEAACLQYYNQYGSWLKTKITAANRSEEMRLLYVAMTRAREKLICVGSVENLKSRLERLYSRYTGKNAPENGESVRLPEHFTGEVTNYLDWLMAGFLSAPGARAALESLGYPTAELVPLSAVNALLGENREDALLLTVVVKRAEDFSPEMPDEEVPSGVFEPQSVSERQVKRLTCPYPYEAVTGLPAKSSVTALTHRQLPVGMDLTQKEKEESLLADEFDLAGLSSESTEEQDILKGAGLKKPAFLLEEGRITGAMRGRATHSFLQFADFAAAKQDLETEIARLVSGQYLTESDAALINRYEIGRFLASSLCARILLAQKQGTLLREYAFIHALPASAASDIPLPEYCREEIVVQGIADCILLSPEGLTLIDYKTDRLQDEADFVARYRSQLAVYADALSLLFADRYENQPPVREIVIYSLYLGREIAVEIEKGL